MILQKGDSVVPSEWAITKTEWWLQREYRVVDHDNLLGIFADDGDFYDLKRLELNGYTVEGSVRCFQIVNTSLENE